MNDLINEIEEIVSIESNLIKNESIVALKHVSTGKYLSSIENLCYTTGSKLQLVFSDSQLAYTYYKSSITEHTEVCCGGNKFKFSWEFKHKVVCHNERLGGNDEWCIELIKQG
ncbi:unnamed protein product [Rhizophagus irregularis]|nr:unnamed protein product [Rhizophagus irregularis]